ncbi:hypothetical protein V9T40_010948 [Parthenolecanium corni]|uniref:Uncharacterized protein n=1 Tax=Parthenolecanium corni TaxID=536013 RepID=A0AAN9THQ3_9HEMI
MSRGRPNYGDANQTRGNRSRAADFAKLGLAAGGVDRQHPVVLGHRVGPEAAWPAGRLGGPGYEQTTRGSERWRRRAAAQGTVEIGVHGDRLTTRVLLPRISCSSFAISQERLRAASDEPNVEWLPATRPNKNTCAR